MPLDYDFELIAAAEDFEGCEEGDISYILTYEKNGISDDDLQLFKNTEGVRQVKAYKISDKVLLIKDEDYFDEYIDISDTYMDDAYSIATLGRQRYMKGHDELLRMVGYEADTVIQTVITGYPDSDMDFFQDYVTEGTIDIDKIKNGEEVILLLPACTYEEYGSAEGMGLPARSIEYADHTDKNALNDTLFNVGDEIRLSEYKLLAKINSGVNEEEIKNMIERNDHTVKIGAIIRSYAGWFDKADEIQFRSPTYMIITSVEAFEKLNIDSTYTRVRIFAEENADMDALRSDLNSLAAEYPDMQLRDKSSGLVSYHELNALVNMACVLLKYLLVLFGCANVILQMLTKMKANRENYRLYMMNGLSLKDMICIFAVQIITVMAVSAAAAWAWVYAQHYCTWL